ncbi:signal recognition particle 9 kDa protein-domain-containing protein [Microdochium trichocladiopsis]|uniref:Signal recognition particle 9 kDa protein-domain-containing protein n=1 Tax=Microdochium trichocladiopsis TaxID=1682393 RepID=A0A9P8YEP7_9PEZI|nr:signal recognition particle 9 kDa protein-domain-containing protein [Microdochium trichocladiopsis]KAH7037953.1 signal recognition particle 9 kDa protein-domain-containing protein [Microdochium trichocladiopsis]
MPYFATSQEWLRQSALLLEARPTTTRITTKYSIAKPKPRKSSSSSATTAATTTTPKPPRGNLTVKTFDPVSGTTLKYRTTKAAEVGRLVLCLGRLGTRMTGLPGDSADVEVVVPGAAAGGAAGEDVVMADGSAAVGGGAETPAASAAVAAPTGEAGKAAGGKGKKKKGKK